MKKKILFMCINMNIGGTEKALLNMIGEIPEKEYDITLLMLEEYGEFLGFVPDWVKVEIIKDSERLKLLLNNPPIQIARSYIKSGRLVKGFNIAIVHLLTKVIGERTLYFKYVLKDYKKVSTKYDLAVAYAGPMDFITYFVANKIEAVKKVQWIHFDITKIGFNKGFAKKIYCKFNKIFVVSEEGRDIFIKLFPMLKSKCEVFLNIVSPKLVTEQGKQGHGFIDNYKGKRILTVGRLSYEKGQDLCIEALKKLKNEGYDVRWYCVGDGEYKNEYEKIIKVKNLEKDFILLGSSTNPYSFMEQCDIYVQPSRHEGYCITLAEVRCFNKPIVTTNFVGANEQILNEETGFVVNVNSYDMYIAIKKILNDKHVGEKFVENLSKEIIQSSSDINKLYMLEN